MWWQLSWRWIPGHPRQSTDWVSPGLPFAERQTQHLCTHTLTWHTGLLVTKTLFCHSYMNIILSKILLMKVNTNQCLMLFSLILPTAFMYSSKLSLEVIFHLPTNCSTIVSVKYLTKTNTQKNIDFFIIRQTKQERFQICLKCCKGVDQKWI